MLSLYAVPAEYAAWEAAVEANGGELTEALEKTLVDILDSLEGKAEVFCRLIKNAKAEEAMCREEARRFTERARIAQARMERLKLILMAGMRAVGETRLQAGKFSIRIQEAGTPSIRWLGALEDLPAAFRKYVIELDGTMAQQAYRAGNKLEGFSVTFAEYPVIS